MIYQTHTISKFLKAWLCSTLAVMVLTGFFSTAEADVVIEGTRIIYKEGERDVTVKLLNSNNQKKCSCSGMAG